jgi:hypothetical protein
MATFKVSIPERMSKKLKRQLAQYGYTVEQYMQSSLVSLAYADKPISPSLEAKLLEALNSSLLRADEIDWNAKIRRVRSVRKKGAA